MFGEVTSKRRGALTKATAGAAFIVGEYLAAHLREQHIEVELYQDEGSVS